VAEEHFATLGRILGRDLLNEFLGASFAVRTEAGTDKSRLNELQRARILGDEKLGPIARNVMKLWLGGRWYRLPDPWHDQFTTSGDEDRDQISSTAAYTEALLWWVIGANPPGAKGPGFATWREPPSIPTD
jgi:hypothetical protein